MPEIPIEGVTNKKGNIRKTVHQYPKLFEGDFGQIREYVILEATWLENFEPSSHKTVSCYVSEMMKATEQNDLIEEYNMHPFTVRALSLERTLCEKIMSLVRFSRSETPLADLANKIRHIYDIHLLLQSPEVSIFFKSNDFDKMMITVGEDDFISYKNDNEWLLEHPSTALIFNEPDKVWEKIGNTYRKAFNELVFGTLPSEDLIIDSIKMISERLKLIKRWKVENGKPPTINCSIISLLHR
jgi:hypothetical protein